LQNSLKKDATMTNDQPIFQDTRQALHVSFLIHSLPSTQKSPTQAVIERLVKDSYTFDYDGAAPPKPSRTVNFCGLTPMEVRAQCAQVVSMVGNMGNPAESAAIKAVYGYQVIKADGVRYLAAYFEPLMTAIEGKTIGGDPAALYVAWHCMATKVQRDGVTLPEIAERVGVSVSTIERIKKDFNTRARAMFERGIGALNQRFVDGGLVEP
jgi:Homeodomain-like domain